MYSKSRDPISAFLYNNKTELIVYKLPIKANKPLNNIIKETFVSSSLLDNTNYWVFSSNHFSDEGNPPYLILYKHGIPKPGDEIYFKLSGNNSRIIRKNDSVATYYSNLINFSIAYNNDNSVDFYGKRDENSADLQPVQIQFKKCDNDVFMLIFLPHTGLRVSAALLNLKINNKDSVRVFNGIDYLRVIL